MFREILRWSKVVLSCSSVVMLQDLSLVGQQTYSNEAPARSLAIPMILLNVLNELQASGDVGSFAHEASNFVKDIKLHVKESDRVVLETVGPDGGFGRPHSLWVTNTQERCLTPQTAVFSIAVMQSRLAGSSSTTHASTCSLFVSAVLVIFHCRTQSSCKWP